VLRIDRAALTYLRKSPDLYGQAAQWLDLIEEFDFETRYRPGKSHRNCDALSRRPCQQDTDEPCGQ
jgi:hypothetical protein